MSRSVRMVGAALIPAFALPLATGNVARAAVPNPPTNNNLPSELDVASPYIPQDTCDPQAKPGVLAFARLMASHYSEFNYGISRNCTTGVTEHSEGRALDWMLDASDPHERGIADSVLAWLMAPDAQGRPGAMARRFGVMYIIFDRQIWGTYRMDEGWRPYDGPNPHTDHIHFSFSWDGAMQRTSWWTGKAWTGVSTSPDGPSVPVTPPTSYPNLKEGARGPDVELAQKVIGVTADGNFGPATKRALIAWQRNHGVRATGNLDQPTWDKMVALGKIPARGDTSTGGTHHDTVRLGSRGESVKALQRILGVHVDGVFGSKTNAAVRAFQKKKGLTVDGVVGAKTWRALQGKGGSTGGDREDDSTDTRKTVRRGSSGAAVKELQRALHIDVDGKFGSQTEKAVKAFQRKNDLQADGIVGAKTWRALEGKGGSTGGDRKDDRSKDIPKTVRRGSSGAAVKELQRALHIDADGMFGSQTEKAVKAFQRKKDLTADGIVGANTWRALKKLSYDKDGDMHDDKDNSSKDIPKTVRRGSSGAAVKKLQRALHVDVDGMFGPQTEKAVKAFQRKKDLTADGIVGAKTWRALLGSSGGTQSISPASFLGSAAATVSTTTEFSGLKSMVLAEGARGPGVKKIQQVVGGIAVDGSFGPTTTKAVRSFQSAHGVRATGVVDEQTWEALEASKYPFLTYRTTVLKPGSTGPAVTALQSRLDLPADGVYGAATEQAVRSLQERSGVTRTGYVGAVTWQALEREARVPA